MSPRMWSGDGGGRTTPRPPIGAALVATLTYAVAVAFLSGCGGGGGDGITPPPNGGAVASVSVTPASPSIDVGGTVQLSAVPRDAAGNAIAGKTATWNSLSASVASVSGSGLVTGVAAGSATITASVDGKSGSATVTVRAVNTEVLATAVVGPAGGTLSSPDIGVTVPASALSDTRTLEIRVSDQASPAFGAYTAAPQFRLEGFPTDRWVAVDVRIKPNTTLDGASLIAYGAGIVSTEDAMGSPNPTLAYRMYPARDSSGWLLARVAVRGQPAGASIVRASAAVAAADGFNNFLDGYLTAVKSADTVTTAHFQVVSYGAPRAELQPLLAKTLQYLEEAYSAVAAAGYSYSYRHTWPVSVTVHPFDPASTFYAFYARWKPYPLDCQTGWFEFNSRTAGETFLWPGVAIHEFFHFTQSQYVEGAPEARELEFDWLREATASWIMEKAPSNLMAVKNTFFRGWRNELFKGLHSGLVANDGYGRGALVKYAAGKYGDGVVKTMHTAFGAGGGATQSFLDAFPVPASTWWPEFLVAYMNNEVYPLSQDELPPSAMTAFSPQPGFSGIDLANVPGGSATFVELKIDPADVGSGTDVTFRTLGADSSFFRLFAFQANAGGAWTKLSDAPDTVVIPGTTILEGKRLVIAAVRPDVVAPFTSTKTARLDMNMGLTAGDWFPSNLTSINDQIVYTRSQEGDTVTIDVADEVDQVFRFFANNGTFQRNAQNRNTHDWVPKPGVPEGLASYGIVASATLTKPQAGWDYLLTAEFSWGAATDQQGGGASWLWFLVPLPFLLPIGRRKTRRVGGILAALLATTMWACDIGQISFAMHTKFAFLLKADDAAYTASAEDETIPLMQYSQVIGELDVVSYKSEYWEYIRDDKQEIVDSVARTRTATGKATFLADVDLYRDGMVPADPDPEESIARLLQLPSSVMRSAAARRGVRVP